MTEEWRNIEGYEGLYQVSNLGRVKSLERMCRNKNGLRVVKERIMKNSKNSQGYYEVRLTKNGVGKLHLVHRLVAHAFIPNKNNLQQVNHKDETRTNNCVENLEWCTQIYNLSYGTRNRRIGVKNTNHPSFSKKVLCVETGELFPSTMEAQRKYGINSSHIVQCCKGKEETCGGYHWIYAA